MARAEILAEVGQEREIQDAKWGGPAHDDAHGPFEWVALLTKHAGRSIEVDSDLSLRFFRHQMISVAAIAVAAVESYDRVYDRREL